MHRYPGVREDLQNSRRDSALSGLAPTPWGPPASLGGRPQDGEPHRPAACLHDSGRAIASRRGSRRAEFMRDQMASLQDLPHDAVRAMAVMMLSKREG